VDMWISLGIKIGGDGMAGGKCGVCNHIVPLDHAQIGRWEKDNQTITPYHMYCEGRAAKLKPCEDCGLHRAFCDECKELEGDLNG
jgi:hypothetical protein